MSAEIDRLLDKISKADTDEELLGPARQIRCLMLGHYKAGQWSFALPSNRRDVTPFDVACAFEDYAARREDRAVRDTEDTRYQAREAHLRAYALFNKLTGED